jgi:hypothetical protein
MDRRDEVQVKRVTYFLDLIMKLVLVSSYACADLHGDRFGWSKAGGNDVVRGIPVRT